MTDKQALRELAEKTISEEGATWWSEDQLASDYGLALHKADAKFIAAANPAIVLALLDELEARDKQIDILRQDKDTVIDTSLERINKILSRAEAAEKRIAELEGREINLPPYTFFDFKQGSPFKSGAYCNLDAVNAELSKLGIKFRAAPPCFRGANL